ncbi:mediator of DNA damage checkpoint protein 1 isoform X2 [Choloepus didactylus]|uniref:mediator of DNA damage checkpoint protein 1 isoform X2 n=1 Tax=Choloepus didactylus TaxID=27675 RepID=UPI00189D1AB8|nr:mediator of DNA damage checkpoint protein 1 isoform X2 [Choloepus didactylus]
MEDTQVIDWEADEEEEAERPSESLGCNLEPLGRLHIFSSVHGPEKDFPLYLGKNVVGRMPDCSVALPFPSISKQHAVIEILALDKAPVLHDCGSLNGTQIVRPPKVLSPGVSHRLRDQELILFADLPCQYHHLDVPPPLVSRAPLTVEETPRVQAGTRPQGLLLAEDSEEEVDLLSESCVVKESRSVSSPLATVVPESDEEGASPAPDGPGPPFAFNLESDTDEECEQPASGEASSAARRGATAEADGVATELHLEKNQPSAKEVDNETKVESATGNVVLPVGVILKRNQPIKEDSDTDVDDDNKLPGRSAEVHLERNQPSAFTDSDTDVEEEGIPATPAMVPVKKRQIFRGVGMESLGVPALAHLQESQASRDIDVEKGEAPLAVPLERSQPPVVINSDTDDEEEISAALALSLLKESRIVTRNRDIDVGEGRAQPVVLLEESQTSAGRDSDTDMEEEGLPVEKRHLPKGHTDKDGVLVIAHSEKSQPPLGDSDMDVVEKDLPGIQLERRQTSTMVDINTVVEEEVPPGPAVTHLEKHQVPEEGTNQTDVEAEGNPAKLPVVHLEEAQLPPDCEMDAEESMSLADSAVADVRKLQLPAEGDAGTEWAAAVLERERALEAGAQGGSLVTQVEQELLPVSRENLTDLVVGTSTSGEPIQPHREGAQTPTEREREPHVHGSKDSEDNQDDSEDLDLQATQCFVERENQSLEFQDMEDEPTQAFRITLPQEAGPSCCSFYTSGALDEPWEVLATQPFCLREAEASETQHIATHLEAHGTSPSPPRATPQDQQPESPVHTEPLGIQIRGAHTMEKDMGTPRKTAERVPSEREPLEKKTKKVPPEGEREREDMIGEGELTGGIQEREQKQLLVRDSQRQESDKNMKGANMERDMGSLKVESEISKEIREREIEAHTLGREILEREAEKESEPAVLEVKIPKVILEKGTQREETEGGSQDQEGQASFPTVEPGVGVGALQGLASAPVTSGSQSGGGTVVPVGTRRQQRGNSNCKMPPARKTSWGDQKSPDAYLPPSVPKASVSLPNPPKSQTTSQSQKHSVPQPLLSPSPLSLEPPIPRTRQHGSQQAPETPMSSELEPLRTEPKVRPRGSSRMTPSPVPSTALEPRSTTHLTYQPISPEPASQVIRGRTRRSSEMTPVPVVPTAIELQPSTSTDQPVTPEPKLQTTWGRTHRSSVKTPEPVESTTPDIQPVTPRPILRGTRGRTHRSSVKTPEPVESRAPHPEPPTPTDQPVNPEPMLRATRGRARRSSVKTPEPVIPTAPELQPSTSTDQPVNPEPRLRATRGRARRSSVKTPEPVIPTAPELQPSTSTDQPVNPEPILRATRGRTHRSTVKTPEPVESAVPHLKPPTSTDQPVNPEPRLRATRGRAHRSSVKTPETVIPTAPELQPSTSTDQPVNPEPMLRATRGRARRSSVKTPEPVIPTASEPQPSTSTDQPVNPEPVLRATRGRTHRSTVKTPEPVESTVSHLKPPTPTDQPVTPEPMLQATRGRARRSSVKTPEPVVPTAPELHPSTSTDQPVTPESIAQGGQNRTLRSSSINALPVPTTPEFQPPVPTDQPIPPEPVPQASCSRRQRTTKKHGSLTAPIVNEPCSIPESKSCSSRSQRRGAVRATESFMTIPEPSFPQLLEAPPHALPIQKVEVTGISGSTPESQPKASRNRKRPLVITDSSPLQKQSQRREGPQKAESLKKEEETAERPRKEEDAVVPGLGKRKRGQAEEEPKETLSHNLRRIKTDQEPTVPRVLFTGVVDARGERAVLALGGSLAGSVTEASHLVTDRIRRTVKFLCALGRGIPILTLDWLHQSRKAGCFLPPEEYVVTDPEQERNFGFSLRDALSRARERRLLEGYEIHVTPGVQPPPPQMGEIISCCGGTVLPSMPRSYKPHRVVITCPQDFPRCSIPFRVGLPLLSPEFLLTGVLKQEAKPEAFILSSLEMSST